MVIQTIQQSLKKGEAAFLTAPRNVLYVCGFSGTNGQVLITQKKAYLITDFRYSRVAVKILPKNVQLLLQKKPVPEEILGIAEKSGVTSVFFESLDLPYAQYQVFKKTLNPIRFIPHRGMTEPLRMVKRADEIKKLIRAQRIAEETFEAVTKGLKAGKTEQEVAWEIEKTGRELGADGISFEPIVGFGKNSGSPHHENSQKRLKKGDMVLIDMGMKYRGYCSDMTRVIFTAKPTPLQEKIYGIVLEAQEAAIKKIKAGITGEEADKVARDIIQKAGYGKTFGHSLGHGIGLEVHEAPNLSIRYGHPLPENTVVTVEPGIYLQNSFGVRIEDMVLVKHKNVVNLTGTKKDIAHMIRPL